MINADQLLLSPLKITGAKSYVTKGIIRIDREELCSCKIHSTKDKVILSKVAEPLTLRDL